MKKSKILMVGLISLLMAAGLVLGTACGDGGGKDGKDGKDDGDGGCNNKNLCYRNDKGMSTCSVSNCAINQSFSGYATCNCN